MKYQIDKTDGKFTLRPVENFLANALDGSYIVNVSKLRRGRSLSQNEWLWGCVYPILLSGLLEAGWELTSTEQVHEFFKRKIAQDKVVNYYTGEVIELPRSTAKMDTQQFSAYVDALRAYASEYLGVTIPEPDKDWRTKTRKSYG